MNPPQENFVPQQQYNAFVNALNNSSLALSLVTPELASYVDTDNGDTALLLACNNDMSEVALALLATKNSNPEQVNSYGDTALILACANKMTEVALALIVEGHLNIDNINKKGNTALIIACSNNMTEVALALIATGKSLPEQVNENGNTALIWACSNNMSEVAFALIETGKSNPGQANNNNDTALIVACGNKMSEVALALVATQKSNPGHVNSDDDTALIYACYNKMSEVALALIATQKSNPGQVNNDNNTALIYACYNKMSEVALALIETGHSTPEQVDKYGGIALIIACMNNMKQVALALIATGHSNPEHVDKNGNTALYYAIQNNMTEVINELTYKINTNKSSYNYIEGNDIPNIGVYHGITFEIDGIFASLSKSELKKILTTRSMIYETNAKYVYTHSFSPIQGGLVLWNKLDKITDDFSSKYYLLKHTGNVGNKKLYSIYVQQPECVFNNITQNNTNSNNNANVVQQQIIVKYQNRDYSINMPEGTLYTYQDVIDILKQREPAFQTINPATQLIRFMFSGRIYRNENLNEVAVPGTHQLIVTQRGTRGGKKKHRKTRKIKT